MSLAKTVVYRDEIDVTARLAELDLEKQKLLDVRTTALAAAADATPFHPLNAAGMLSYQHGTFALRRDLVGAIWLVDRPNGVEAVRHDSNNTKIVFANVDVACSDAVQPQARSNKGAGSERLCSGNDLFGGLEHFAPSPDDGASATYYLMVAPDGAVELSRPIVKSGKFESYVERIYLSDGSDLRDVAKLGLDNRDAVSDFDPQVVRK